MRLFESRKIRSQWDAEKGKWFFAIVDVVAVLTDTKNPQVYWRVLKKRLVAEGNEPVTNCNALKMEALDGKMRMTDVADIEQLLRIIQSVPSPKAEPFKQWLAKVGYERIEETQDPEKSIDRPPHHAFIFLSFSCNAYMSSRSRAASMKSRSRAAFSISFLVRAIAFSTCGMV